MRPRCPPRSLPRRHTQDAEEQYQLALRSQLTLTDALLDLQYSRVKARPPASARPRAGAAGG